MNNVICGTVYYAKKHHDCNPCTIRAGHQHTYRTVSFVLVGVTEAARYMANMQTKFSV